MDLLYTILGSLNFAKISKPLTELLKKDEKFEWAEPSQDAFEQLKIVLCTTPVLAFPDFTREFVITTDASNIAIGGILSQGQIGKDRPISYYSRVLRGAEPRYEVYEKEALALVACAKRWRYYIYGRFVTFVTDHQALLWFPTAGANTRVQKWRFKLSEYNYKIIHRAGKINVNADALSRNPTETQITFITRSKNKKETSAVLKNDTATAPKPKRKIVMPKRYRDDEPQEESKGNKTPEVPEDATSNPGEDISELPCQPIDESTVETAPTRGKGRPKGSRNKETNEATVNRSIDKAVDSLNSSSDSETTEIDYQGSNESENSEDEITITEKEVPALPSSFLADTKEGLL